MGGGGKKLAKTNTPPGEMQPHTVPGASYHLEEGDDALIRHLQSWKYVYGAYSGLSESSEVFYQHNSSGLEHPILLSLLSFRSGATSLTLSCICNLQLAKSGIEPPTGKANSLS